MLEQQPDKSWRIMYTDGSSKLYVDPEDRVPYLRRWLPSSERQKRYDPKLIDGLDYSSDPPALHFILGSDKVCHGTGGCVDFHLPA